VRRSLQKLSKEEIRAAFAESDVRWSPSLRPAELAQLLGVPDKTVYLWIELGRLEGAFRKRGKHILIWRDRAIELLFNGPEWVR
jgi:excisionase family DNA binding protein